MKCMCLGAGDECRGRLTGCRVKIARESSSDADCTGPCRCQSAQSGQLWQITCCYMCLFCHGHFSPLTRRVIECKIMRSSLLCVFLRQNCTDSDQIIDKSATPCSNTMIVLRQSLTRFVATDLPLASQLLSKFSAGSMQSISKHDYYFDLKR